jgi:peptidoglycan/xylan/chitin deacetylase (PgdA/CDA1 family)
MKSKALCVVLCLSGVQAANAECSYDSNRSMLSRVVAVDSSNGSLNSGQPGAGASPAPQPFTLNEKEIVLTFDQGPHSKYTDYILFSLDKFCVKAVFFFAGSASASNPAMVREAAARGHTIAAGPWSLSPDFTVLSSGAAKIEIEKGLAAVEKASGTPIAPFFRAPSAFVAPQAIAHLKERGVSLWSYDIASGDTGAVNAAQLQTRVMTKLRELGKGVIQFHDTSKVTVDAIDDILSEAKQGGFKVVQPVASVPFKASTTQLGTLPDSEPEALHLANAQSASRGLAEEARRRAKAASAEDAEGRPQAGSQARRIKRSDAGEGRRRERNRSDD